MMRARESWSAGTAPEQGVAPAYRWVTLTTDYGLADGFVAACHGVIATIAPEARIVDVTHGVPAHDVRAGARTLARTVPYLPEAVHLVVVDPGVGTTRRGIVVLAEHGVLVGPDNGVLVPPARALGGAHAAIELTDSRWWLARVSRTFHGRDIFAPVAARLATGVPASELGTSLPLSELCLPPSAVSRTEGATVRSEVVGVDHFGNLQLATPETELPRSWTFGQRLRVHISHGEHGGTELVWAETFGDVADQAFLAHIDSTGHLEIAVNGGSAADRLAVDRGSVFRLAPR